MKKGESSYKPKLHYIDPNGEDPEFVKDKKYTQEKEVSFLRTIMIITIVLFGAFGIVSLLIN